MVYGMYFVSFYVPSLSAAAANEALNLQVSSTGAATQQQQYRQNVLFYLFCNHFILVFHFLFFVFVFILTAVVCA